MKFIYILNVELIFKLVFVVGMTFHLLISLIEIEIVILGKLSTQVFLLAFSGVEDILKLKLTMYTFFGLIILGFLLSLEVMHAHDIL